MNKNDFRLLKAAPVTMGILLALLLGAVIYSFYQMVAVPAGGSLYLSAFLTFSQRTSVVFFLGFSFATFEFLYLEKASHLQETLIGRKAYWEGKIWKKILLMMGISILFSFVQYGLWMMAFASFGVLKGKVAGFFLLVLIINYILPSFVAVLFGGLLALLLENRIVAYLLSLIFVFFMLPFAKLWAAMFVIRTGESSFDLMRIVDFFDICAQNLDSATDLQYGVPIEISRWYLALFWIAFLAGAIFLKTAQRKSKRILMVVPLLCCVVGMVGFLRMGGDSVVRYDTRLHGIMTGDIETYDLQDPQEATFSVDAYDMQIKVRSRLYADVSMTISQTEKTDTYLFTLYHGYKVNEVLDGEGNALSYQRTGDYLDVTANLKEGNEVIRVIYEGSGNRYYSNYQGIALMGYFAWYPRAGHLQIFELQSALTRTNISETSSKFHLAADIKGEYMTNLNAVGEDEYEGQTNGVTVLSGLMQQMTVGDIRYCCPVMIADEIANYDLKGRVAVAEDYLAGDLQVNTDLCMTVASTIADYNGANDAFAALADHTLMREDGALVCDMIMSKVKAREGTKELYTCLSAYPFAMEGPTEEVEKPAYEDVLFFILYDRSDEEYNRGFPLAHEAYYQLFEYQVNTLGEKAVFQACYEYLNSDSDVNEVDFLYNLDVDNGGKTE